MLPTSSRQSKAITLLARYACTRVTASQPKLSDQTARSDTAIQVLRPLTMSFIERRSLSRAGMLRRVGAYAAQDAPGPCPLQAPVDQSSPALSIAFSNFQRRACICVSGLPRSSSKAGNPEQDAGPAWRLAHRRLYYATEPSHAYWHLQEGGQVLTTRLSTTLRDGVDEMGRVGSHLPRCAVQNAISGHYQYPVPHPTADVSLWTSIPHTRWTTPILFQTPM